MNTENRRFVSLLLIVLGIIIVCAALILAFSFNYNRFYSFLLIGLFIILKEGYRLVEKKDLMSWKIFLILYAGVFFIFGLIGDLTLGIWLCKLWSYPSYNFLNYVNLYLLIYPLGGMVMVYSFAFIEKIFGSRIIETKRSYLFSKKFSLIIGILGVVLLIFSIFSSLIYRGFFIYLFGGFFVLGFMSYFTLRIRKDDLVERMFIKPVKYLILILVVAYTQGFLHEFPNVFAKEWVYHNFPYESVTFFNIPVTVLFFGWIALVVGPYMIFEFSLSLNKLFRGKK